MSNARTGRLGTVTHDHITRGGMAVGLGPGPALLAVARDQAHADGVGPHVHSPEKANSAPSFRRTCIGCFAVWPSTTFHA